MSGLATERLLQAVVAAVFVAAVAGTLLPSPAGPLLVGAGIAVVIGSPFAVVVTVAVQAARSGRWVLAVAAAGLLLLVGSGTAAAALL